MTPSTSNAAEINTLRRRISHLETVAEKQQRMLHDLYETGVKTLQLQNQVLIEALAEPAMKVVIEDLAPGVLKELGLNPAGYPIKSLQEIFTTSYNWLMTQGKDSVDSNGTLVYHGVDGLKCSIGILMKDEYKDRIDVASGNMNDIDEGEVLSILEDSGCPRAYKDFYKRLLRIHDDCSVEDWDRLYKELAEEYGLAPFKGGV